MKILNYHHLRLFWAVASEGNLTRASGELHLAPQTVSTQIRDLEESFGVKLFGRQGRGLVLTETGRIVFRYAEDIFNLGRELQDVLRGLPVSRPMQLTVGISEVVPKIIAHHLIEPATQMKKRVHIICREGNLEKLLADLAIHQLDVVLSDSPIPPTVNIKAYNHILGKCGIKFMAMGNLSKGLRKGFPQSLNGAPFLAPVRGTVLRQTLDKWFGTHSIFPEIVGEFEDSALLKVFGQTGAGFFAIPSVIEPEVTRQYLVQPVGLAEGISEHFYAISVDRQIKHPAVTSICDAGRSKLFRQRETLLEKAHSTDQNQC